MTDQLNYEQFAQHLHGKFKIQASPDSVVEVELAELSDFRKSEFQESFWLVFRGPASLPLGQGTFVFENDAMGRFDIFMTPIKQDAESLYYEVVFNRLVTPERSANG